MPTGVYERNLSKCKKCNEPFKRDTGGASRTYCARCRPGQGFIRKELPERPCIACGENFKPLSSTHSWCKNCKEDDRWFRTYGISRKEKIIIFEKFGGKCYLCDRPANRIDHDHKTDRVRGALCGACNVALSESTFEDPCWRVRALRYIEGSDFPAGISTALLF